MPNKITEKCTGCTLCKRYCPVNAISGERKQQHAIDPQLCIECNACGHICNFGAVLDRNGLVVASLKPAQWSHPVWDYKTCTACNICVQACPTGAIGRLEPDGSERMHAYPYLANSKICISCSFCADSCPIGAIAMRVQKPEIIK
jgi:electron transport complex protein RnfB